MFISKLNCELKTIGARNQTFKRTCRDLIQLLFFKRRDNWPVV